MKQFRQILGSSLAVLAVFTCVLVISCKKKPIEYNSSTLVRPCENVICLNGGACLDGQCNCATGYQGLKCETKWTEKFAGTFVAADECSPDSTSFYNVEIVPDVLSPNKMVLKNIGTFCSNASLQAIVQPEKTAFEIPLQNTCGNLYLSGYGNINANYINVYLQSRDSMLHVTNSCSIVMNR